MDIANFLHNTPACSQWKRIGIRQHHGVCVALFSLRGAAGGGIGEYLDLLPLISWLKGLHCDVLQLLPLNDSGERRYPYGALSAFALNPVYLSLKHLPQANNTQERREILRELTRLNALDRVDYVNVYRLKQRFLRDYFKDEGQSFLQGQGYASFREANPWLDNYALFKVLRRESGGAYWREWVNEWRAPGFAEKRGLIVRFQNEIEYQFFVQYLCFQQMLKVKDCAEQAGIWLKGDIPILLDKNSADVWSHQDYFQLDYSAGAPPDYYNPDGQDWGFPLYRWDNIARDGYGWWKARLRSAEQLYHIYRLDHVVGFYRIWAVRHRDGVSDKGYIPADSELWIPQGEAIMHSLLEGSRLLPIGEDLGTVPDEVRISLKNLGICGTKVVRWERINPERQAFIPYQEYDPVSLTTVSTHDSETLASWWRTHPEDARQFCAYKGWEYHPALAFDKHVAMLSDSHRTPSLFHINLLQEYLAPFPDLVWEDPGKERINVPGVEDAHNWTYRMRPTVEHIVSHEKLAQTMRSILEG